jgi:hypothetical protein
MAYVIQFNEQHKWAGHFGYIVENKSNGRFLINVSFIKDDKVANAYIFANSYEFDIIGETTLITKRDAEESD